MGFLESIKDLTTDFLFPRNHFTLEIEALPTIDLLELLPQSVRINTENTLALFDYSDENVKKIIWEIKYKGNTRIARRLGTILYDTILGELEDKRLFENWGEKIILIPIPVSDKRRFARGWNQSEILADEIMANDTGKLFEYLPNELIKTLHTESQTKTQSRKERRENLVGSMEVLHPEKMAGRGVVVVDDVTTTGSTFAEARRALEKVGVKKILCVALAH